MTSGNVNSFSMMRIQAIDKGTNLPRSFLDIVVPASSEMNCASCHETAAFANYVTTFSDASPPPRIGPPPGANLLQATDFSTNLNSSVRVRENILILHDALGSYGGSNTSYPGYIAAAYPGYNSLWEVYQAGTPILCAKCHYSKALDLAGTGPDALQADHLYLSRGMHKHHGTAWPMMDKHLCHPDPRGLYDAGHAVGMLLLPPRQRHPMFAQRHGGQGYVVPELPRRSAGAGRLHPAVGHHAGVRGSLSPER